MTRHRTALFAPLLVLAALALLLISSISSPLSAAALLPMPPEVWVCPTGNCGAPEVWQNFSNLQTAVLGVAPGGTVHVAAGTYVGGATLGEDVTIDGEGPASTVIQGASRVFTVAFGTATLSDMAIVSGTSMYDGGGVYISSAATATLSNCEVSGNFAPAAGGGIVNYGRLTLVGCSLSENTVYGFGGGLSNAGLAFITDTEFISNSSGYVGGALANGYELGTELVTLHNVTFEGNTVEAGGYFGSGIPGGGAMVNGAGALLRGSAVQMIGNSAYWDTLEEPGFAVGGGIYNMSGADAILEDVHCSENGANKGGCAANLNEYFGPPDVPTAPPAEPRAWGLASPLKGEAKMARPISDFGPTWLTMTNASILSNTVSECGGGILNTYWVWPGYTIPASTTQSLDANLTLVKSTLHANRAMLLGGGICNGSNATGVNIWLSGNHAGLGGGVNSSSGSVLSLLWYYMNAGILTSPKDLSLSRASVDSSLPLPVPQQVPFGPEGSIAFVNAVFSGNQAHGISDPGELSMPPQGGVGGGFLNFFANAELTNVTMNANRAFSGTEQVPLGNLMSIQGILKVTNCIMEGGYGPAVFASEEDPPTTTVTYSDIEGGWLGAGNINVDPSWVDPDGDDNVVGTLDDDLRLGPGSLASNAGDDSAVPPDWFDVDGNLNSTEPLPIDLDGAPRFVGTVDMGAYEAAALAALEIRKTDLSDPVPATWKIYYTIRVTNTTAAVLDPVVITDTLPAGTYFVSADLGGVGSYGSLVVVWEVELYPGEAIDLHVVLGSFSTLSGVIANYAAVWSPGVGFAETTETTTITSAPPRPPTPTPTPTPVPTATPPPPATIGDSLDTYIYRYAPQTNYWLAPLLKVGFKQTNASLIRFDLSEMPPAGSTVDEAWLEVYAAGWSGLGSDITIGAYAISTTVVVSQTTWNEAYAGDPWQGLGCMDVVFDRRPLPESAVTTAGPLRWYRFDVAALLQDWVDGDPVNTGVLLKQETTTPYAFFFASQEYPNPLLQPRLVIRYH